MDIRNIVLTTLSELMLEETGEVTSIDEDLILLESGLDSLGLAVLITRLESILGFDPFSISEAPYYPRSLKEFIAFYEKTSIQLGNETS